MAISFADAKAGEINKLVDSINNQSRVSVANAGNAQTVMGVANQLKENIDNLDRTATELGESMGELKTEISVFKI